MKSKKKFGWLKVIFGILTAVDISLLGWLAQNYENSSSILLFLSLVLITCSTIGIVIVNKLAYKKIRQMKDL